MKSAIALFAIVALSFWLLSPRLLNGLLDAQGVSILTGSRLYRGQALSSQGDLVRWQWCPSEGLLTVCVTMSGNRRYLETAVTPGLGGITQSGLSFSGYRLAEFGVRALGGEARVSGNLEQGELVLRNGCLFPKGTVDATFSLEQLAVLDRPEPLSFRIAAEDREEESGELRITGEEISGELHWSPISVNGEVILSPAIVPDTMASMFDVSDRGYVMPLTWRLPCG